MYRICSKVRVSGQNIWILCISRNNLLLTNLLEPSKMAAFPLPPERRVQSAFLAHAMDVTQKEQRVR